MGVFLGFRRTPSPPLRCSPLYPIARIDSKTTTSARKAIAASSAMLPLVIAQTVAFDCGFGGRISAMENTWPGGALGALESLVLRAFQIDAALPHLTWCRGSLYKNDVQ